MVFVNVVRGITRPLLTLIWLLSTVIYLWFGVAPPEAWWALGVGMIGWWFYDRTRQNRTPPSDSVSLAPNVVGDGPVVYVDGVPYQPALAGAAPTQPTGPPEVTPTHS